MAEPHPVSERPITVLVAEDEDLVRRLVSQLLGNEGYRILEARDGGEALHLAHCVTAPAPCGDGCRHAKDGRVGARPTSRGRLSGPAGALHLRVPPC